MFPVDATNAHLPHLSTRASLHRRITAPGGQGPCLLLLHRRAFGTLCSQERRVAHETFRLPECEGILLLMRAVDEAADEAADEGSNSEQEC